LGSRPKVQRPWHYNSLFFSRKDLSNEPSQVQFNPKELKLYLKSRNFLGKGPSQGQIPALLGHGSKSVTDGQTDGRQH
jgi:hypothetical protein